MAKSSSKVHSSLLNLVRERAYTGEREGSFTDFSIAQPLKVLFWAVPRAKARSISYRRWLASLRGSVYQTLT